MADKFQKETSRQRAYRAFEEMIAAEDIDIDLVQAAFLIASIEYPELDTAQYLSYLDVLARRVEAILALATPPAEAETHPQAILAAINTVLFVEEGFHGNRKRYYDPNNSFFNKVLEDRTGIPLSLSLLYMEIGRRVGLPLDGIALPFHFMLRCHLPQEEIYIDAFEGGRQLNEEECKERVRRIARGRVKMLPGWFEPISHKLFLARMLNNLKKCYIEQEDYERMLVICDLLILLVPGIASEWRDRGIAYLQLQHYSRALQDLVTYLDLAPQAHDRSEMLNYIKTIRQIMARMN